MITVGISESGSKIKLLSSLFFSQQRISYGTDISHTDKDFILLTPAPSSHYDILIENTKAPACANADYIHLLNSDDINKSADNAGCIFITYGLNSFSTATASSITIEDASLHFHFCLQRNIVSLSGKRIECQEFPVSIYSLETDIHTALAFTTLSLIAGICPDALSKVLLPY